MKRKWIAAALCLIVLISAVSSASALQGFNEIRVNGNLRLPVYSAPSTSSWRGANGKALCNTNGRIAVAGQEGGWVLIAYELTNGMYAGSYRVGYVHYHELKGLQTTIPPLHFKYQPARIIAGCSLTDDPMGYGETITSLSPGTTVTYLMGYENEQGIRYAYIETSVGWQTARGFVRYDCVQVNT